MVAAKRTQLARNLHREIVPGAPVQFRFRVGTEAGGDQVQRLLVHGTPLGVVLSIVVPAQRVQRAGVGGGIAFQTLFDQPSNRAFAAADRTVQQQHAFFDAVTISGAFESIHQSLLGPLQPKNRIPAVVVRI